MTSPASSSEADRDIRMTMSWAFRSYQTAFMGLLALGAGLAFGLPSACAPQAAGGSKTNWYKVCDESIECGEVGSCICGLCTLPCSALEDCADGKCGSTVATASQCEGFMSGETNICLPGECEVAPLEEDDTLSESPAPGCSAPGALICESFDETLPASYLTSIDGGEAELQDCVVQAGASALRMSYQNEGGPDTRIRLPDMTGAEELHLRFFMNIAGETQLPTELHILEFWDGDDGDVAEKFILSLIDDGDIHGRATAGPTEFYTIRLEPLPRDEWLCVQLSIGLSSVAEGTLSLSINGEDDLGGTNLSFLRDKPFTLASVQTRIGYQETGTNAAVFFDELVIGSQPIACD